MNVGQRIRKALQAVGDIDREASKEVPDMSLDDLVSFGQRVWWLTKRLNKAIEPVKARIREHTVSGTGTQRLESLDGSFAIVSPQPANLVLRKDTNIEHLKASLGDKFDTMFDTVVTYRPKKDIQDQVANLNQEQVMIVMSVVDMTDTTPKVTFKD